MNERIQELREQAMEWVPNQVDPDTKIRLLNAEKFAELIVRECMRESMDEIVADEEIAQEKDPLIREYLTGNNQGIVDAVIRFRNLFGVEE
jgi:uncharacterized protein YlzI (FlbEa/FlbD family)